MSYNGRLYYPMKLVTSKSSSNASSRLSSTTSSATTSNRSSPINNKSFIFRTTLGSGAFSGYGVACTNWNGNMLSIN